MTSSRMLYGLAAVAAAGIAVVPARAEGAVYPQTQCVTYNASTGSAQVRFGAFNTSPAIVTLPPGDDNFFSPPPPDREQPNQFVPGFTTWDMTVQAGGGTLNWTIQGNSLASPFSTAAAGLPFERPCAYRGPEVTGVEPATLTAGGDAQTLTVFGQGLGAGANVTIDGVASAVAPSAATANRLDVPVAVGPDAAPGAHDLLVTDAGGNQTGCRGCVRVAAPAAVPAPLPGVQGPQGAPGPQGPGGAVGARTLHARAQTVRGGRMVSSTVSCPAGTRVLSGGYELAPVRAANPPLVVQDQPVGSAGWRVSARGAKHAKAFKLTAYAVCA